MPAGDASGGAGAGHGGAADASANTGTRSRGHSFTSLGRSDGGGATSLASSRVQATLYKMPTLESLFQSLPTHLAFDVEVKYPVETHHRCRACPCSPWCAWCVGWVRVCVGWVRVMRGCAGAVT